MSLESNKLAFFLLKCQHKYLEKLLGVQNIL